MEQKFIRYDMVSIHSYGNLCTNLLTIMRSLSGTQNVSLESRKPLRCGEVFILTEQAPLLILMVICTTPGYLMNFLSGIWEIVFLKNPIV